MKKNKPENIWKYIDRKSLHECWEWTSYKDRDGYGKIKICGKNYSVHRLVYKEIHGEIRDGMWILHKCNNPSCCNPEHLYLGTPKDNTSQKFKDGRANNARGEQNGQSKLKEKDILEIRRLYFSGKYSQTNIGKMFGVGQVEVYNIINRKVWKHI